MTLFAWASIGGPFFFAAPFSGCQLRDSVVSYGLKFQLWNRSTNRSGPPWRTARWIHCMSTMVLPQSKCCTLYSLRAMASNLIGMACLLLVCKSYNTSQQTLFVKITGQAGWLSHMRWDHFPADGYRRLSPQEPYRNLSVYHKVYTPWNNHGSAQPIANLQRRRLPLVETQRTPSRLEPDSVTAKVLLWWRLQCSKRVSFSTCPGQKNTTEHEQRGQPN